MTTTNSIRSICSACQAASRKLAASTLEQRRKALKLIIATVQSRKSEILASNAADCDAAVGLDGPAIKRLRVTEAAIAETLDGLKTLSENSNDPVGRCQLARELAPGLQLYRTACPIGVICVIYEARPLVAIQLTALTLMTGNGVIFKGGKEASRSNEAIAKIVREALSSSDVPIDSVCMVQTRSDVQLLLKMNDLVDLVVPRGSKDLVTHIKQNTTIPVLGHADGICHTYVDRSVGDVRKAVDIIVDGKTNYPAACNATETLLVHREAAAKILPAVNDALKNVCFKADAEAVRFLPNADAATDDDYYTEWLGLSISVRVVGSVEDAVMHINKHGSKHTDVFVGEDMEAANFFVDNVDAANVFCNCSSRFSDGFRYGFGAEVGISTNKIHSRGPVGTEGLLIYKYKLIGNGHTVGAMGKECQYTHVDLPIPDRVDIQAVNSAIHKKQ